MDRKLLKLIVVNWQHNISKVLVGTIDYQYNVQTHSIQINNFDKTGLTQFHFDAIDEVFSQYKFDSNTIALLPRDIPNMHPCKVWLKILQTQLNFNIIYKDLSDMIKRLLKYHCTLIPANSLERRKHKTAKEKFSTKDFKLAWDKLIQLDACPWINNQTNTHLFMNNSSQDYFRLQKIYFALYYMMIRKHYLDLIKFKSK